MTMKLCFGEMILSIVSDGDGAPSSGITTCEIRICAQENITAIVENCAGIRSIRGING
jgi:hypothetical protein